MMMLLVRRVLPSGWQIAAESIIYWPELDMCYIGLFSFVP